MPTWPAAILGNTPLLDGFSGEEPNNVVANQPDRGPPKTRMAGTTNVELIQCMWGPWDATQKAAFQSFFRSDCKFGALPYTHPVWIDGLQHTIQFDPQNRPKLSMKDQYYFYTVSLMIWQDGMV